MTSPMCKRQGSVRKFGPTSRSIPSISQPKKCIKMSHCQRSGHYTVQLAFPAQSVQFQSGEKLKAACLQKNQRDMKLDVFKCFWDGLPYNYRP